MFKVSLFKVIPFFAAYALCGCGPSDRTAPQPNVNEDKKAQSVPLGSIISNDAPSLTFRGWSASEKTHRWSTGKTSSVDFVFVGEPATVKKLALRGGTYGEQHMSLSLNGKQIFSGKLNGSRDLLSVDIPAGVLRSGNNTLTFDLPDARSPGGGDPRVLGFSLMTLQLE